MIATMARKLRFGDAAYAIGATPKTLRHWLVRDQVRLVSDQRESGWAEYSFADIAILALVRVFATFGWPVKAADLMAHRTLEFFPDFLEAIARIPDDLPSTILAFPWVNRRLAVTYDADNPDQCRLVIIDMWKKEEPPAAVFLSVDVEAVLRRAFARALESVTEGGSAQISGTGQITVKAR